MGAFKQGLITAIIIVLAWTGGINSMARWGATVTACLCVIIILIGLYLSTKEQAELIATGLVLLVIISISVFLHPNPLGYWKIYTAAAALCAMQIGRHYPPNLTKIDSIILLVAIAPLLLFDNPNIVAFWPFALAWATGFIWHLALLPLLLSRGSILGTVGAAIVFFRPKPSLVTLVLVAVVPLYLIRPETADNRLGYWATAWQVFIDHPWGIGPGGLGQHIVEPGGGYQMHSHNILLTFAAENGFFGLCGIILAALALPQEIALARWQWAFLAGLAVWSMVDEPLFWPGPLIFTGYLLGVRCYQTTN